MAYPVGHFVCPGKLSCNKLLQTLYPAFMKPLITPDILGSSRKEQIMFLMWIIPLLLVGLIVYAISGNNLVNAVKPASSRACLQCGQNAQNDWKVCPHCGQTL
jgi:hypothetical protein